MFRTLSVGYFAYAQYNVKSPIVGVADTSPEGGSKALRHSERSEESHRRTDRHILLTLVVGYFACAQYDVLFLLRHSERSEESHRRTDGSYTFSVGYFTNAQYDALFLLRHSER